MNIIKNNYSFFLLFVVYFVRYPGLWRTKTYKKTSEVFRCWIISFCLLLWSLDWVNFKKAKSFDFLWGWSSLFSDTTTLQGTLLMSKSHSTASKIRSTTRFQKSSLFCLESQNAKDWCKSLWIFKYQRKFLHILRFVFSIKVSTNWWNIRVNIHRLGSCVGFLIVGSFYKRLKILLNLHMWTKTSPNSPSGFLPSSSQPTTIYLRRIICLKFHRFRNRVIILQKFFN